MLFDRELTDSSGGNISVRDGDKVYINPIKTGQNKQWHLDEGDVIVTAICAKYRLLGK
jgi:ribulose-5-phosphate 4-epimerase/fuculose-1-phosphate aldolase